MPDHRSTSPSPISDDDGGADGRTDQRDEVEDRHHQRQRDGVLPEPDDLEEDERRDSGARRHHERSGDVATDLPQDLVAERRSRGHAARPGTAEYTERLMFGSAASRYRVSTKIKKALNKRVEHGQADGEDAAEDRLGESRILQLLLGSCRSRRTCGRGLDRVVVLQVVEIARARCRSERDLVAQHRHQSDHEQRQHAEHAEA